MLIIPLKTFSEKSLNVGNPRGLKGGEDMHDADVAIEDWQTACRNLAELTDAIIKLSAGSYVIETLLEELISVVRCEADAWHEVQQCGFNDRDETIDFCQKFKGLSGTSLAFLFLKQKTR